MVGEYVFSSEDEMEIPWPSSPISLTRDSQNEGNSSLSMIFYMWATPPDFSLSMA